ncbi:hypothetical protein T4B_7138 [Trichinella pseudospiralis]|uniref:Uncharacterized protein n=1 Tax=Trichinella pseudospiralis TaxID=6337 RepID=A0A0V1GIA9_TRIPS|nr:hypothetical protein T4B_7138 [Trichinella pseudospiralis]
MSFLPINLATVKASATDIAHQAGRCGVESESLSICGYSLSLTHKYWERGDYAKVDKKVNHFPYMVGHCP